MITEIDFKVTGEERKKLAYAIGVFFARPFCIKLQKLFVGRCSCIL